MDVAKDGDAVQSTFIACVASVLRLHSSSLQNLVPSIKKRRQIDGTGMMSDAKKDPSVSLVEVVLHTEPIQRQVAALATVCGLNFYRRSKKLEDAKKQLPSGIQLLSELHADLLEADNQMGPMIK